MQIARVVGSLSSTIKNEFYRGKKIMIVQPLNTSGEEHGDTFLSVDTVQAGKGDIVLVLKEGGGSRIVAGKNDAPIHSTIIGIVDEVNIEGEIRFGNFV